MKHFYIAFKLILLVILLPIIASAQMDSCNVFLQGNYLEVGINWNGAFGTSSSAPTGYHPKGGAGSITDCNGICYAGTSNLAFVADPDKDGWTVGSPYMYIGDYCLPGLPQEGWSIMADGIQGNAWNGYGCSSSPGIFGNGMVGGNVSYSSYGTSRNSAWEGSFDSIIIAQITTIDINKLYATVQVSFRNTGSVARKNAYYLRTIDADNTQAEGGQFTTINKIEAQVPNALSRTIVSSLGLSATNAPVPSAYLALGTNDCRAKAFIIKSTFYPSTGTLDSIYGKYGGKGDTVDYKYSGTDTADEAIGLAFQLGDLEPGVLVTINFAYLFDKADIDSILTPTAPTWYPNTIGATVHKSGDTAVTCQNTNIAVAINGGDNYSWNWVSPSGATVSPTTGVYVNVPIDSTPITLIAIGTSPCSGNDTLIMTFNPTLPTVRPNISISGPFFERVGKPVTINAVVTSAGGAYTILWRNNGVDFSSTATPSVTYTKGPGIDKIKAFIMPLTSSCYNMDSSNLWVVGANTTGVAQLSNSTDVQVYPNPFTDAVQVSELKRGDIVTIYDAAGKVIDQTAIVTDQQTQHIKLENLSSGYYILKVSDANNMVKASVPLQKL